MDRAGDFILALIAHILPGPRTIDDAFITFRYSRNIVSGAGFVYNPGVHTLGTTTPLYTLLMALISAITGHSDFQWYAHGQCAGGCRDIRFTLSHRASFNRTRLPCSHSRLTLGDCSRQCDLRCRRHGNQRQYLLDGRRHRVIRIRPQTVGTRYIVSLPENRRAILIGVSSVSAFSPASMPSSGLPRSCSFN